MRGGFTGMTTRTECDTALLRPLQRKMIEGLAENARARGSAEGAALPDFPEYIVDIDGSTYVIRGEPPPEWLAFLDGWHSTNPSCPRTGK